LGFRGTKQQESEETYTVGNLSVFLTQHRSGDKIEEAEMGGTCGAYGDRKGLTRFWWGNLRERDHLGDP
jgi:hypothetical protein